MRQLTKLFLISLLLVLLAACQNSEVVTDPNPDPVQVDNRLSTSDFATAQSLFADNCQFCHAAGNEGIGPDFNNHLPTFTKVENGKTHLINALLFGMTGPITVNGQDFNGNMGIRGGDFDDTEIALLLNYGLTAWDNSDLLPEDFTLITAAEVAIERQTSKTPEEVYTARQALQLP